jgi:hypothetical protein
MTEEAEVVLEYTGEVEGPDRKKYGAKAIGRQREDGRWEGWIEFNPVGGGEPVRSDRETTQPKRRHLVYWATGLTPTYLEGALARTLDLPLTPPRRPDSSGRDSGAAAEPKLQEFAYMPEAILDPFRVHAQGSDLLRSQLSALGKVHLVKIVKEYRLSTEDPSVIEGMQREDLIPLIVKAVEARKT